MSLFGKKAPAELKTSVAVLNALDGGGFANGNIRVTPEQALGVMAVFAARRVISEDVAKLPAKLKKENPDGSKDVASDAPEHVILSRIGKPPNEFDDGFTAMEWIEQCVADAALDGFGVVHLNRVAGRCREVTPIPRGGWRVDRGNRWQYKDARGEWQKVDRRNLMVLRGPQLGANVTHYARQSIDLAIKFDAMMHSLARKSGRPNGIFSVDRLGSLEIAQKFIDRVKAYFGPTGDGGLMPVDLGAFTYQRLSLTPEEMQQDATYGRLIGQIASAYRVQPARLMYEISEQNNASAYTWNIIHVNDCIQPWTKRFKGTFEKDVLGVDLVAKGFYCDIALQGLLQGSPAERSKYYLSLRTAGAISPLTIARLEDLPTDKVSDDPAAPLLTNPNPGGDGEGSGLGTGAGSGNED